MVRTFLLALLCIPSLTFAADDQWHWVKVGNNADHAWDISKGDADVVIKAGQFSAKLFLDDSTRRLEILLKGSITNGKLTVRETVLGSDYSGDTYSGTLTVKKWAVNFSDGVTGAETITLSNTLGMIGITRALKRPSK